MKKSVFDLDKTLINLAYGDYMFPFSFRAAVEGIQLFGGIGSGKSSGSAYLVARKLLEANCGGLVLTAKPDERNVWEQYVAQAGRSDDLIVLGPGSDHAFNFLQYEAEASPDGMAPTENLVNLLKTVIKAGEEQDRGKSNDPFWDTALDMLVSNVIDLCRLAYSRLSIQLMYDIVQTIPKQNDRISEVDAPKAFQKAFELAQKNVTNQINTWVAALPEEKKALLQNEFEFEQLIVENLPDARLLKLLDQFFFGSFQSLAEKTRSIIDFSFSSFLFRLLREPVYSLLCRHDSTFKPEDSLEGKIILIDLSVKTYHEVGRDSQILFKYIWQRAMEKRDINENGQPVFLFADESQNFIHPSDSDFQATARSSRVITVYATQNISNYYASMGGQKSEHKVKSFLGTLATKIFHANAHVETNSYASELFGEAYFEDRSDSVTVGNNFSQSRGRSYKLERMVRPEEFVRLKTGGPANNYKVEGYIHRQGAPFPSGYNHLKALFKQSLAFNQNSI